MEKKTKKPEMKVVKGGNTPKENPQKLSYEQLNEVCAQLYQQNQQLTKQVQQLNNMNLFKRLDYLFEVLKYEAVIKDADFVNDCIDEIKDVLTIEPAQPEEPKELEKS